MGMFDRVWVPCPRCGHKNEFQSKGGDCTLHEYNLQDAPADVLGGLMNRSQQCEECGAFYEVHVTVIPTVLLSDRFYE